MLYITKYILIFNHYLVPTTKPWVKQPSFRVKEHRIFLFNVNFSNFRIVTKHTHITRKKAAEGKCVLLVVKLGWKKTEFGQNHSLLFASWNWIMEMENECWRRSHNCRIVAASNFCTKKSWLYGMLANVQQNEAIKLSHPTWVMKI